MSTFPGALTPFSAAILLRAIAALALISASIITPAAIAVAVVPAVIVTSPVNAGI